MVQDPLLMRNHTALDLIVHILHQIVQPAPQIPWGSPAHAPLNHADSRRSQALIRVDHAGEIAAQGLYLGQALSSRNPDLRRHYLQAAEEERCHLGWCTARLAELGSQPSHLTPLWYLGSIAIGLLAGALPAGAGLGFVVETERQVEAHLHAHLRDIPPADLRSHAMLSRMQADEVLHALHATQLGAHAMPAPVRAVMRWTARIMTTLAPRF